MLGIKKLNKTISHTLKLNIMKKIKCLLRLHGSYREIHLNFDSITEAKQWVKNCWDRPYTIVKLKN